MLVLLLIIEYDILIKMMLKEHPAASWCVIFTACHHQGGVILA